MHKFQNIIILLVTIVVLAACDRNTPILEQMDMAEELLNTKPDSAFTILENIPVTNRKGKEIAARYALLKSMALDKNYIDTTTFDVLQPAIDYYLKKGSPDEKLRTYYYQGRIYQNQGDDDSAMQSFLNAIELKEKVTDSLILAHTFVAQGTLYLKQYKINEFVQNNIEAARLYGIIGKDIFEIKSYTNAVDGYVMLNNQSSADSLLSICLSLVKKHPDGEAYLFSSYLSYTINFGSPKEIKEFLTEYKDIELTNDDTMNIAHGYSKIGEYDKAMKLLSCIKLKASILDSLKYASVKFDILDKQGQYKEALQSYKDFSAMLERYQSELISHDLLFSDKKHQLEIENLMKVQERDRIIWATLCGIFAMTILVGWLYYRAYRSKTRRILAEKENANLKLMHDNLRKEKENAELERDKKILEAESLKLEISQLENERDNLKELQSKLSELAKPIQDVIKIRLDMLNGLLAKEISNNESYAEPYNKWIEIVRNDKKKFMDSTRLAFTASHPQFMEYLEQHGLSTDEINYLCLYAIGMRGKEVGEYLQTKRHYIISHEIRKKLGIDEHETNIGLYIRRLMKHCEE